MRPCRFSVCRDPSRQNTWDGWHNDSMGPSSGGSGSWGPQSHRWFIRFYQVALFDLSSGLMLFKCIALFVKAPHGLLQRPAAWILFISQPERMITRGNRDETSWKCLHPVKCLRITNSKQTDVSYFDRKVILFVLRTVHRLWQHQHGMDLSFQDTGHWACHTDRNMLHLHTLSV